MADKWTDRLRTEMEEFQSMDIPEGLWEGIEQKLDAKRAVSPWRRYIAVAAVALLIFSSVGILFMHNASEHPVTIAKNVRSVISKEPVHTSDVEDMVLAELKNSHSPANVISYRCPEPIRCGEVLPPDMSTASEILTGSQRDDAQNEDYQQDVHEQKVVKPAPSDNVSHTDGYAVTHTDYTTSSGFKMQRRSSVLSRLSARIFTAMSSRGDAPVRQGYMTLSASGKPENQVSMYSKSPFGNFDKLYLANALDTDEEVISEANHSLPVRLGASVGYDIDDQWTLNTGVVYTKLHSTLTSGTSSSYYTNNQNVHYLGIPLSLHYNILNRPHLRFYGAAGGMVEFGVKGDVEVTNITRSKLVSTEHNNITDIPVQYSANAALGAEYDITHGIGIYAEPGISYYFKNTTNLSTIYSAHPLNFNLQIGLRWNILQK